MQTAEPLNGVFWEIDGKLPACPFDETEHSERIAAALKEGLFLSVEDFANH